MCWAMILISVVLAPGGKALELLPGGFFAPCEGGDPEQIDRPTQFRGQVFYYLLAQTGAEVRLHVHAIQVGQYTGQVEATVTAPDGSELAKATVELGQVETVEFTFPEHEGLATLHCHARRNAVSVQAEGCRLLLSGRDPAVKIFEYSNPLHFFVEPGRHSFPVYLAGQGKLETARAALHLPDGALTAEVTTVEHPVQQVEIRVPPGMDGKIWSVHVTEASQGVFEDAWLKFPEGVAPFLSERRCDVIVPALRLEAPILVRPEERPDAEALACVPQSLRENCENLQLQVLDSQDEVLRTFTLPSCLNPTPWSLASLEPGDYRLQLSAFILGEEVIAKRPLYVTPQAPYLKQDKTLLVNEQPFFARGLYHVNSKDYELVKAQGFNIVQARPNQVPDCERAGLKAAVALYGGMRIDPDHYREMITEYRSSPAVACWMTMDEPSAHGVPLRLMAQGYSIIRGLSDHPAYTCICRPEAYMDYGRCTDIIAIDVYPVGRMPLTAISNTLEIAKKTAGEHTLWFIGQVWSYPNTRLVTPREHRCMSYLALTHANVRGLFWYSFRDPDWYLPESNPEVWEMCAQINRELTELEPVLLENSLWERVQQTGPGEVHLAAKHHKAALYIIAVNPTEHPAELNLDLCEEGARGPATEVFEERRIDLIEGHLVDRFEPLDTHVYMAPLEENPK